MLMIEPHAAANTASAAGFCAADFRRSTRVVVCHSSYAFIRRNRFGRCAGRVKSSNGIRATAQEHSGSDLGPVKQNAKPQRYHPFEEVDETDLFENGSLSPAETSRTVIEVNSKATLMFSGFVNEEVHENIFWPDLPYVTDEHGNIYFQVKNDEDILQTLTTEETIVQAIIGLDTAEMLTEMESMGRSDIDFGADELDDEDSDFDEGEDDEEGEEDGEDEDNYEKDWVAILDEENEDEESDGSVGDWAKLETMRSSHPMHFAKKLAEVASDDPLDFMEQPSAGIAIQGLLRPAFVEEQSVIQKHISGSESNVVDRNQIVDEKHQADNLHINGHKNEEESTQDNTSWAEELEKDENLGSGFAFYKLEMIKIQLISGNGHQNNVEIDDFRRAQPDAIAHSAGNIISHLKAGGEKTIQALKAICWRCKGIQADECSLIGVDSLGFDLRVCSGAQIQTLRFSFKKRASSEYSAERQLNDLLFPRAQRFQQKKEEAHPTES